MGTMIQSPLAGQAEQQQHSDERLKGQFDVFVEDTLLDREDNDSLRSFHGDWDHVQAIKIYMQ